MQPNKLLDGNYAKRFHLLLVTHSPLHLFNWQFSIFFTANAFLSLGQDKTKGPDPLIQIVVHPEEHVIIPIHSFAFLHCEAKYTPEDDQYTNDEPGFALPNLEDYEQNDSPTGDWSQPTSNEAVTLNLCQQEVQYQWLQNEKPLNGANHSVVETFCNGTIKIKHSSAATGIYRCVANTTQSEVGAVVSKASNVRAAGEL